MKTNLKLSELIIFFLIILLIFSEVLSEKISPIFSYIDEIYTIIIISLGILYICLSRKKKFIKEEKKIILIYCLIVVLGLIGNKNSGFQSDKKTIIIEIITWSKLFLTYVFLLKIVKVERCTVYYKLSIRCIKLLLIISCFLEILNLTKILPLSEGYDRFGIPSFSFFGHPSSASSIFAVAISILTYDAKKNKKWIFIGLALEILTFRFKGILFSLMVIYIQFFMNKKVSFIKICFIAILAVIMAWNQIEFYFLNSTASRAVALNTSIKIANDFLPVGSGFATFGTALSGKYYSEAYYKYGLDNRWGFTKENYAYIGDGGWATIIAQFGWSGTILFAYLIYLIIKSISKKNKSVKIVPFISLVGYILIASTNETIFISAYSVLFSLALIILLNYSYIEKEQIENDKKNI